MFILKEVDAKNVEEWINSQTNPYISKSEEDYGREYESLLVGIIGFSSIRQSDKLNKLILDPHEFNKDTARKLTAQDSAIQGENEKDRNKLREALESKQYTSEYLCYMLTPDQLMAVKDLSPYIIIEGNYGCGKTYVLKERAKLCAENYPESKIAYINLTIDDNSSKYVLNLMDIIAENNFEFYNNVNVVTAKHLIDHYFKNKDSLKDINRDFLVDGETCCLVLKHFLKQSNYDHVFIDEMPPFNEKVTVINHSFTSIKSFCITMRYDIYYNNINERWIKHMEKIANVKRLILKHNMRNTDTIDKLSTGFYENTREKENLLKADIIPNKNIIGPVCYHYHNIHDIDGDMLARAAIQKYFPNKKESVVVIYDPYISNAHTFCMYLLQNIRDRNIVYLSSKDNYYNYDKYIEEVKQYLDRPEGVLETDLVSFQGAQARNMVLVIGDNVMEQYFIRNMILRTMSFALIVHREKIIQSPPGLVTDVDLHDYIHPKNAKPVCYLYNNIHELNRNILASAIMIRYFSEKPNENILILTPYGGESLCSELHTRFSEERHIVHVSSFKTSSYTDIDQYLEDTAKVFDKPGSILITNIPGIKNDFFEVFKRAKNIVIFTEYEYGEKEKINQEISIVSHRKSQDILRKCRNVIMKTDIFTIVTHVGKIDEFKPFLKVEEITDLDEYITECQTPIL